MSSNPNNLVVSPFTPRTKLVDDNGFATWDFLKFAQGLAQAVNNALDILGQFNGVIGPQATIASRTGTLQDIVQHLTAAGQLAANQLIGIVQPAQLPAADPAAQGAVQLPAGAPTNVLGSAALSSASAFDPAGAASTAQTNAETFASGVASTAQLNAETYTDGKFTGAVGHVVTLAKITTGGANGSLTFNSNGLLTGFVDPT